MTEESQEEYSPCIMQFSKNRTIPLLWENTQLTEKQRKDCKKGKKW